jgi:hypothetical protein
VIALAAQAPTAAIAGGRVDLLPLVAIDIIHPLGM